MNQTGLLFCSPEVYVTCFMLPTQQVFPKAVPSLLNYGSIKDTWGLQISSQGFFKLVIMMQRSLRKVSAIISTSFVCMCKRVPENSTFKVQDN